MAPGPHHLVLRDLPARAAASPATRRSTPRSRTCSTRTTKAWARGTHAPQRGLALPTERRRHRRTTGSTSTTRCTTLIDDVRPRCRRTLIELGLHHEQQHQELLLMDIKHVLSCNPPIRRYRVRRPAPRTFAATAAAIRRRRGGLVEIGHDGDGFAFDNEGPRHIVLPRAVRASPTARSPCGEWLEFIADDGYAPPDLWLSDGWDACRPTGWDAPLYWRDDGDDGWTRVHARRPAAARPDTSRSCHVSHYEADAFARWRGARLPDRVRVGARGVRRLPELDRCATVDDRGLAVDRERVPAVPALSARARRGR